MRNSLLSVLFSLKVKGSRKTNLYFKFPPWPHTESWGEMQKIGALIAHESDRETASLWERRERGREWAPFPPTFRSERLDFRLSLVSSSRAAYSCVHRFSRFQQRPPSFIHSFRHCGIHRFHSREVECVFPIVCAWCRDAIVWFCCWNHYLKRRDVDEMMTAASVKWTPTSCCFLHSAQLSPPDLWLTFAKCSALASITILLFTVTAALVSSPTTELVTTSVSRTVTRRSPSLVATTATTVVWRPHNGSTSAVELSATPTDDFFLEHRDLRGNPDGVFQPAKHTWDREWCFVADCLRVHSLRSRCSVLPMPTTSLLFSFPPNIFPR